MIADIKRIASLSNVEYKEPVKQVRVVPKAPKKKDLMETREYKSDIKEAVTELISNAEKDSQITFRSVEKEKITINDKNFESSNIKGIITIFIGEDDIKKTKFSPQEIAYEIKSNKEAYKKADLSDITDGNKIEIDECFVSLSGKNVVIKVYFSN